LDELRHLLDQLGLGAASDPIYDMIMDLHAEAMDVSQLEQAIRSILSLHGCEACADAVLAALAEVNFWGLQSNAVHDGEVKAAGDEGGNPRAFQGRVSTKR
jgi:hypothetical protein